MNPRVILLLLVLAGAIGLVIFWPSAADAATGKPPPPPPKATPIPVGQQPQVTVQTAQGPVTLVKKWDTTNLKQWIEPGKEIINLGPPPGAPPTVQLKKSAEVKPTAQTLTTQSKPTIKLSTSMGQLKPLGLRPL